MSAGRLSLDGRRLQSSSDVVRGGRRSEAKGPDLLGCRDGGKVSRYERFHREPNLRTALAYEVIFNVPVRELFAGASQKVERKTLRKIGLLGRRLSRREQTHQIAHKLEALAACVRVTGKDRA